MAQDKNEEETSQKDEQDVSSETEQPEEDSSEEVTEEQTAEDSDSKGFDPLEYVKNSDLPDDQKEALKSAMLMKQDYTRKTQALAKERRAYDEWRKSQIVQQQGQPQMAQQPQEEPIPDDPREFYNSVYTKAKTDAVREAVQQTQAQIARERDITQASQLDERLNNNDFGRIVASLVESDDGVKHGNKSFTQATKDAIAWYDNYAKDIEKKTKQDITNKARSKKMVTPKKSSPAHTSKGEPQTIHEAYEQALEELSG